MVVNGLARAATEETPSTGSRLNDGGVVVVMATREGHGDLFVVVWVQILLGVEEGYLQGNDAWRFDVVDMNFQKRSYGGIGDGLYIFKSLT